jgi:hypothetical protein
MAVETKCPSCRGPLRVPEELFNQRVQCPTCNAIFLAAVEHDPTPTARPAPEPAPPRRPPLRYDGEDNDDNGRPPRRYREPHRGAAILTLGILSLVMTCFPLGIVAWVMGNTDLEAMRRGRMDPSGEGLTQAGRICGIISTVPVIIACVLGVLAILTGVLSSVRF